MTWHTDTNGFQMCFGGTVYLPTPGHQPLMRRNPRRDPTCALCSELPAPPAAAPAHSCLQECAQAGYYCLDPGWLFLFVLRHAAQTSHSERVTAHAASKC